MPMKIKHSNKPWYITKHGYEELLNLHSQSGMSERALEMIHARMSDKHMRPAFTLFGKRIETAWQANDSTWVVPIKGAMIKGADEWDMLFGATSHESISDDLDMAVSEGAENIILDVDSPGGTVLGTPELANKIDRIRSEGKTIITYSEGMVASAALYLGTVADHIAITPSTEYGSVGVLAEHISWEGYLADAGITVEQITSGEYKGAGSPLKDLTEAQRDNFQAMVDETAEKFYEHVEFYRPSVERASMRGQMFSADRALEAGFIDEIVPDFKSLLESIT